jgi:hypothetical protein
LKIEKIPEMNSLSSLFCGVSVAHTTKQTTHQKWLTPLFGFARPLPKTRKVVQGKVKIDSMLY